MGTIADFGAKSLQTSLHTSYSEVLKGSNCFQRGLALALFN